MPAAKSRVEIWFTPEKGPEDWKNVENCRKPWRRQGGFSNGVLADANFEAPKTLFLKAFRGLKNYLDYKPY